MFTKRRDISYNTIQVGQYSKAYSIRCSRTLQEKENCIRCEEYDTKGVARLVTVLATIMYPVDCRGVSRLTNLL